jgi:hypothetical protein
MLPAIELAHVDRAYRRAGARRCVGRHAPREHVRGELAGDPTLLGGFHQRAADDAPSEQAVEMAVHRRVRRLREEPGHVGGEVRVAPSVSRAKPSYITIESRGTASAARTSLSEVWSSRTTSTSLASRATADHALRARLVAGAEAATIAMRWRRAATGARAQRFGASECGRMPVTRGRATANCGSDDITCRRSALDHNSARYLSAELEAERADRDDRVDMHAGVLGLMSSRNAPSSRGSVARRRATHRDVDDARRIRGQRAPQRLCTRSRSRA